VNRTDGRQLGEGTRQPLTHLAGRNDAGHLLDEGERPCRTEARDADVLRVALVLGQRLRNRRDEAAAHPHLHLLVAVRHGVAPARHEQRVVASRGEEIVEQLRMEEDVAVQHEEPVQQQIAREPERVEAVGRRVPRVVHDVHVPRTAALHLLDAEPGDDGDAVDPRGLERVDLPVEQRAVADAGQALRPIADDALQPPAASRGQDDGPHSVSSAGRSRVMCSICASFSR
jgi:hypothetical protein